MGVDGILVTARFNPVKKRPALRLTPIDSSVRLDTADLDDMPPDTVSGIPPSRPFAPIKEIVDALFIQINNRDVYTEGILDTFVYRTLLLHKNKVVDGMSPTKLGEKRREAVENITNTWKNYKDTKAFEKLVLDQTGAFVDLVWNDSDIARWTGLFRNCQHFCAGILQSKCFLRVDGYDKAGLPKTPSEPGDKKYESALPSIQKVFPLVDERKPQITPIFKEYFDSVTRSSEGATMVSFKEEELQKTLRLPPKKASLLDMREFGIPTLPGTIEYSKTNERLGLLPDEPNDAWFAISTATLYFVTPTDPTREITQKLESMTRPYTLGVLGLGMLEWLEKAADPRLLNSIMFDALTLLTQKERQDLYEDAVYVKMVQEAEAELAKQREPVKREKLRQRELAIKASRKRANTAQRPWTAQSRPSTARPQTAVSTRYEGNFVIALLEGRGVGREVGLAALDKDTGRVTLVQLSDCQTYVKTLHQMHLHRPSLILIPDTFLSASDATLAAGRRGKGTTNPSFLVEFIREEFPDTPIESMPRRYWNETSGLEFIQQLCVEDDERAGTILAVSTKYYVLSACSALFKHTEIRQNTRFSAGSLRIRYSPVDGTMMIDPESARNLELVANMSHRKSYHSVFGILNHTYTAMAARLLRSSIDARLDVVEEFVQDEDLYNQVRGALKTLNKMDFDKLIAVLAASETRDTTSAQTASARVTQLLNLRGLVRNLPLLRKALSNAKSQLSRIIHEMLSDERIETIDSLIRTGLNEDTNPVKANYNRLLDVARETYKENVGDIYALCNALAETHELPIVLVYQESGFVFSLRKTDLEKELPKGFINVTVKKGKWQFSSMELKKMNARMQDALDESLILSDKIIQDLVAEILMNIGVLYKASEAVALIDMLWAFAHSAIMRPEFTGTLAVKSGRHPILETIQSAGTLVPNDIYCDDSSSFQTIQGPNMSGKSTYLRQIGLLSIMAMCGSFVPAEYASFRIHDALLTRLSNDDDLEKSLSTFASEMATSAMILGLATEKSLILVDELGRGTSPREGIGISHAIAEELIEKKCFVFFATINKQNRSVDIGSPRIVDGAPEDTTHYGLELARLADFPDDVLTEATRVSTRLAELQSRHQAESNSTKVALRRKALLRLRTNLTQAYEHSTLPDEELLAYIERFQADVTKAFLYPGDTLAGL
ncbi:hypothetical protein D9757_006793 [Collybiopsis confluens]|uniref:DNA mismatch repair proteins mutS family domain-containing protein n=1 Tax=Collybiopsis confluens TaxID=2823264 RepID=A0A8H5M8T9_9AGAR|nr:hypothetical protein D9757_006793 [Collybiopsis confluens]